MYIQVTDSGGHALLQVLKYHPEVKGKTEKNEWCKACGLKVKGSYGLEVNCILYTAVREYKYIVRTVVVGLIDGVRDSGLRVTRGS